MEIKYSYRDAPTISRFAESDAPIRGLMGPFGCVAGDTLIITEHGAIPISDINRPMRVLSWSEKNNRFELSLSGGSYRKGEDYLYRVTTQQGEFVAAGFHRVFCADGSYRRIDNLSPVDALSGCFERPPHSISECVEPTLHEDDPHLMQTISNWMGHYAESARQYGQRLLENQGCGQFSPQLQGDAQELDQCFFDGSDDLPEPSQGYNHQDQHGGRQYRRGFYRPTERQLVTDGDHIWWQLSECISALSQGCRQSLRRFVHRYKEQGFLRYFRSYDNSLSERPILSIERLSVKQEYWDLQILDNHNYVTEDGAIHHNSGKSSGCSIEIVARAHAQAPGLDGIRRTRWAIIRNTYQQLKDTTIRTVFDWFPPDIFGTYNKSDHNYTITAFEGLEIEFLFRALDRPEQVSNLLSLELTSAWVNEAREIPWSIITALLGRINRYPSMLNGGATWAGLILDTNPPEDDSWWYELFEERIKPGTDEAHTFDAELFKQPSGLSDEAENTKYLAKGYYKELAKLYDRETCKVYVEGRYGFIRDGKPVYIDYNDALHCDDSIKPVPGVTIYRGWDFGLMPACIYTQITPRGRWIVFDELLATSMGADRFSDEVLLYTALKYPDFKFEDIGDPAGDTRAESDESTCFEVLQGKGIAIEGGLQDPEIRIGSVSRALRTLKDGKPQFALHPRCRVLRKGFLGRYKLRKLAVSDERYALKPDKNEYSHPHDALQYIATRLFGDQVKGIIVPEKTPTRPRRHTRKQGWMSG